ncbi:lytic transglycosylase domain-containing protein [Xanthomonas citri]|uniref:lytic transglycosylase domain-containing protein n=1 Tax=Xanthomonas citri TaxID=346 RepID=UPI000C392A55|nr:lytic transglycosylase domain-containing protein [Xanthomonas citri]SOO14166.1 Type IV secretion system protein virB1 [Xanthomonas citri pv. fuscans]
MIELMALAQQCAPNVAPETVVAIARVESSFNPYAIGVVGGALKRQPASLAEALSTVRELERQGRNFSIGMVQVNRHNLPKYGLTYEQAFEPCQNLRVGGRILQECYARALPAHDTEQLALRAAFSCYYSGNFIRGFRPDRAGEPSYVQKVVAAASAQAPAAMQVPAVELPIASARVSSAARPRFAGSVLVDTDSAAGAKAPLLAGKVSSGMSSVQPFALALDGGQSPEASAIRSAPNAREDSPAVNAEADDKVVF